jgi:hypothetical protein
MAQSPLIAGDEPGPQIETPPPKPNFEEIVMNRTAIALAAALIAGSSVTTAAQAGVKLGFGLPLGVFVASQLAQGAHNASRRNHYENMRAQNRQAKAARAAKAAAAKQAAAKRQAIARAEAAEARAKAKAQAARVAARNAETKTAKVEAPQVTTEAGPVINVPSTPTPVAATVPAAATVTAIETAKIEEINDAVKIEAPKSEQSQQVVSIEPTEAPVVEAKAEVKSEPAANKAERICRRFSAAIAGLNDVPCEQ